MFKTPFSVWNDIYQRELCKRNQSKVQKWPSTMLLTVLTTMVNLIWSSPYERVFWWQIWKVFRPSLHMVTNVTIWMLGMKGGDFHFQIKMVTGLKQFQMVTCSNGDKFNLKWIVSFISNGDTIKWWHIWFEMKWKIIIDFSYHWRFEYYIPWFFLHNTCQACYRLLKLVTMKIRYHKMVTAKSQSAIRKWNSSAPACCKLFIIITGNYEHPYIVNIKMVNTKSKTAIRT